jgi:hypothetical protein
LIATESSSVKKVQPNKLLVMKRNSRICTNDTRKIVSAGMKKNRLMKIY